jgi:hypothetical protein
MNWSKKVACIFGILTMVVSFAASSSMAAVTCTQADILMVGPNAAVPSGVALQVKCLNNTAFGGGNSVALTVHPDLSDQILATALTALSLGSTVYITAAAAPGLVTKMYLNK